MKGKLLIAFLVFTNALAHSQYNPDNLEKYWYYSQRFKDNFIVISSGDEQGTNIPAMIVKEDGNMDWNDGNSGLQYYIGMLATEYRLLKDYGLNYQNTLNQLDYAIKAIERLDREVEALWEDGYPCSNGFFMRDDVPSNFAQWAVNSGKNPNLAGRSISSTFTDYPPALGNSQDNVWNYLPNLALVAMLVDEPGIVARVKKLAGDMVNNMHGYDFFSCPFDNKDLDYDCPGGWGLNAGFTKGKCYVPAWIIRNPTTEGLVPYGGHIYEVTLADHSGRQWGFAEAAEFITGKNHHYNGSGNEREIMVNMANLADEDENWSFKQLFAVIGYYWDYIDTRFDVDNPYHEYIPLVWEILHNDLSLNETGHWKTVYENLLDLAPNCGPHYYSNGDHQTFWDYRNRLSSDQGPLGEVSTHGDFSGIDYMLLHNLYWLCYHPSKSVSSTFPQASGYGGNTNPAIIKGGIIVSQETLNSGANVSYIADAKVTLKPGFKVNRGVTFTANVNGSIPYYHTNALIPECDPMNMNPYLKNTESYSSQTVVSPENTQQTPDKRELKVDITPNPVKSYLEIVVHNNLADISEIYVYSNAGELVYSAKFSGNSHRLNTTNFNNGIYIIKLVNKDEVCINKIVKSDK